MDTFKIEHLSCDAKRQLIDWQKDNNLELKSDIKELDELFEIILNEYDKLSITEQDTLSLLRFIRKIQNSIKTFKTS